MSDTTRGYVSREELERGWRAVFRAAADPLGHKRRRDDSDSATEESQGRRR